jgi:hypothetical protein
MSRLDSKLEINKKKEQNYNYDLFIYFKSKLKLIISQIVARKQ